MFLSILFAKINSWKCTFLTNSIHKRSHTLVVSRKEFRQTDFQCKSGINQSKNVFSFSIETSYSNENRFFLLFFLSTCQSCHLKEIKTDLSKFKTKIRFKNRCRKLATNVRIDDDQRHQDEENLGKKSLEEETWEWYLPKTKNIKKKVAQKFLSLSSFGWLRYSDVPTFCTNTHFTFHPPPSDSDRPRSSCLSWCAEPNMHSPAAPPPRLPSLGRTEA